MVAVQKNTPARARLSASDWDRAALDVIAADGLAALSIEALARTLGVTKGSFYWHFPTREALITAALERWEQHDASDVLAQVAGIADPRLRLRELFHRVSQQSTSHIIYAALLQASDHPLVRPVLERTAQRRLLLLSQAYREAGFAARPASFRARLAYTAYAGFLQLAQRHGMPRMDHDDYAAYVEHVIQTLIPD